MATEELVCIEIADHKKMKIKTKQKNGGATDVLECILAKKKNLISPAEIPKELTVKHPLSYKWVLWYYKMDGNKSWIDGFSEVMTFNTIEDFWALYNHVQLASRLPWKSDYYLFKEGIKPMWEDPANINGGRWLIQISRDPEKRNEEIDYYWLNLLLAIVGEQFEEGSDYICGAVVNVRQKGDKISLWTKDASKEEINRKIGIIVKQKLNMHGFIMYEVHKDTKEKTNSTVKAQLRV